MSALPSQPPPQPDHAPPASTEQQKRQSFWLVLGSTLIIAVSQTLIKGGTGQLADNIGLVGTALSILTTPQLFAGYALYGLVMVIMVVALRHAELSLIYPVISLSYVWVAIISIVWLNESLNVYKLAGVTIIVGGVAVLGLGGGKKSGESKS